MAATSTVGAQSRDKHTSRLVWVWSPPGWAKSLPVWVRSLPVALQCLQDDNGVKIVLMAIVLGEKTTFLVWEKWVEIKMPTCKGRDEACMFLKNRLCSSQDDDNYCCPRIDGKGRILPWSDDVLRTENSFWRRCRSKWHYHQRSLMTPLYNTKGNTIT